MPIDTNPYNADNWRILVEPPNRDSSFFDTPWDPLALRLFREVYGDKVYTTNESRHRNGTSAATELHYWNTYTFQTSDAQRYPDGTLVPDPYARAIELELKGTATLDVTWIGVGSGPERAWFDLDILSSAWVNRIGLYTPYPRATLLISETGRGGVVSELLPAGPEGGRDTHQKTESYIKRERLSFQLDGSGKMHTRLTTGMRSLARMEYDRRIYSYPPSGEPGTSSYKPGQPRENTGSPGPEVRVFFHLKCDVPPGPGVDPPDENHPYRWVTNLAMRQGWFAVAWNSPGGAKFARWNGGSPQYTTDVQATITPGDRWERISLAEDPRGPLRAVLSGVGGGETVSGDGGATWGALAGGGALDGRFAMIASGDDGSLIRASFLPDSIDKDAPGVIKVSYQGSADPQPGPVITLAGEGGPMKFAQAGFDFSFARESAGRWILTAFAPGGSLPSHWAVSDAAKDFTLTPL